MASCHCWEIYHNHVEANNNACLNTNHHITSTLSVLRVCEHARAHTHTHTQTQTDTNKQRTPVNPTTEVICHCSSTLCDNINKPADIPISIVISLREMSSLLPEERQLLCHIPWYCMPGVNRLQRSLTAFDRC